MAPRTLAIADDWTAPGKDGVDNEDRWGTALFGDMRTLWLIDGCTDLDRERSRGIYPGGMSSARWYAEQLSERLASTPYTSLQQDPAAYIKGIIADIGRAYGALGGPEDREDWAHPSATLLWVASAPGDNILRLVLLGDSYCLISRTDGTAAVYPDYSLKPAKEIDNSKSILVEDHLDRYREVRGQHIREACVSLSVFADRLGALRVIDMPADAVDAVMLTSDGFFRFVDALQVMQPADLFRTAAKTGLAAMGADLRRLEKEQAAAMAASQPKIHDDATAVLARFKD